MSKPSPRDPATDDRDTIDALRRAYSAKTERAESGSSGNWRAKPSCQKSAAAVIRVYEPVFRTLQTSDILKHSMSSVWPGSSSLLLHWKFARVASVGERNTPSPQVQSRGDWSV